MGQRANYILLDGKSMKIYYHHWRANCIYRDLLAGPKRFIAFVQTCKEDTYLIPEPWIEGCVVVDMKGHKLWYWNTGELSGTSFCEYGFSVLKSRWSGWEVNRLTDRMYGVECLLGLSYLEGLELPELRRRTKEDVESDNPAQWIECSVVIKSGGMVKVRNTQNIGVESILSYGMDIVPLLLKKADNPLPAEDEEGTEPGIVVDMDGRNLYVGESMFGVWEQCKEYWPGFKMVMGDFGYIQTLDMAGLTTDGLRLSKDLVEQQFKEFMSGADNFDPNRIADRIRSESPDVQFNPDFFENPRPSKAVKARIGDLLRNLFSRKG